MLISNGMRDPSEWMGYLPIDKGVIDAKVLNELLEHGGEFSMGVDLVFTRKHARRVDLTTIPTKGCHIEVLMDDNTEKARALSLFTIYPKTRSRDLCAHSLLFCSSHLHLRV